MERGQRERMPKRRRSETHEIRFHPPKRSSFKVYFGFGFFADGRLGEVWLTTHKPGSDVRTMYESWARTASAAVQHGLPVKALAAVLRGIHDDNAGTIAVETVSALDGADVLSVWDALGMFLEMFA